MGISLSNHENRIKKLEEMISEPRYIWISCCSYMQMLPERAYIFIPKNVIKIKISEIIESTSVSNEKYINLSDVNYSPKSNIINPSGETSLDYIAELADHYKYLYKDIVNGHDNRITIWGLLKLYYNFSYNIYRLVVSISKSFLKCLIKIRNQRRCERDMAISLKELSDRITKPGFWIPDLSAKKVIKSGYICDNFGYIFSAAWNMFYRNNYVMINGHIISRPENNGENMYVTSSDILFPVKKGDKITFSGFFGATNENGEVYYIPAILTIYYIVRYNIYKLVMFLSHLNTTFGGERR